MRNPLSRFDGILRGLFFCFVLLLLAIPLKTDAIGASPAVTKLENIPLKSKITREISVSRGNPSQDQEATITVTGGGAPYITLPNGSTLSLPKGQQQTRFPVLVDTTNSAAGTYSANVTISLNAPSEAKNTTGTGSSVLSGVSVKIEFSVTTDAREEYEINKVTIQETEEGQPVGFSYQLINTGGIDARPTSIALEVTNQETKEKVYAQTIAEDELVPVKGFSDGRVDVLTKASLPVGRYSASFIFSEGEKSIFTDTAIFQVFPRGTLAQKGDLASFTTDKPSYKKEEPTKLSGGFKNTGTVGIAAAMVVELFRGSTRIDLIKTDEIFVPIGQSTEFDSYYTPKEGGAYTARGYVTYGPFKTDVKEIHFTVNELNAILIAGVLAGVVVLLGLLFFILKKRRHNKSASPVGQPDSSHPQTPINNQ